MRQCEGTLKAMLFKVPQSLAMGSVQLAITICGSLCMSGCDYHVRGDHRLSGTPLMTMPLAGPESLVVDVATVYGHESEHPSAEFVAMCGHSMAEQGQSSFLGVVINGSTGKPLHALARAIAAGPAWPHRITVLDDIDNDGSADYALSDLN